MSPRRRDGIVLAGLIGIAAVVRLAALPSRGTWDADQGHDMNVLLGLVRDGTIPLLGPPTSIGDFHHGALYYYLLAPAALISSADPTWVVAEIALAGIAAVALTWSLARSIGGPLAGAVAALLMALSASAIDESTFIWNPNLIAFSSALALAAAWRCWTTGRARWSVLAAFGVLITMHCHVLGFALVPPVAGLLVLTWRRAPGGPARRRLGWSLFAGVAIIAAGYLPLAAYELGHDFAETRAAAAFILSGGSGVGLSLPARLVLVALRILSWPLTGLLTDGLVIGTVAGVLAAAGLAWRVRSGGGRERDAARWLGATLLFGWLVLTFGAAGLSTVTPLPVDHYHAFLDPVVFVAVGLTAAAAWRSAQTQAPLGGTAVPSARSAVPSARSAAPSARLAIPAGIAILLAWNVWTWPPAVDPDGGWPAGRAAGDRIEASTGTRDVAFVSLPVFKTPDAYSFPLARDGSIVDATLSEAGAIVIVCDALFISDCGGAAEEGYLAEHGFAPSDGDGRARLVDRWEAAPRRTLSVYLMGSP